jgi:hypothetical protein
MDSESYPDSRIRWEVGCKDPLGRDLVIGIGIDGDNQVVTVVPAPGEGMIMTPEQSRQASVAYDAAYRITQAAAGSTS